MKELGPKDETFHVTGKHIMTKEIVGDDTLYKSYPFTLQQWQERERLLFRLHSRDDDDSLWIKSIEDIRILATLLQDVINESLMKYRIEVSQYATGFVATAYDEHGLSIIDSESKPTEEEARENLKYWLIKTEPRNKEKGNER